MNEEDRQTITSNLAQLVQQTDLDLLIPKLLEKGVFSSMMIEKYLDNRLWSHQRRNTEFYLEIQRRGPEAFEKLLECLDETGHSNLALLLKPSYVSRAILGRQLSSIVNGSFSHGTRGHSTVPAHLPAYFPQNFPSPRLQQLAQLYPNVKINFNTVPLQISVKPATVRLDGEHSKGNLLRVYHMGSRPKGYFLMINNITFQDGTDERRGAEVDETNLTLLFEGLGYEVIKHRNLELRDMRKAIEDFSQMEAHRNVDSCVVAILSHGHLGANGDTNILATDGFMLSVNWIIERFNNYNCPNLMDCPKIFIFQVCRGDLKDHGRNWARPETRVQTDGRPMIKVRSYSDMLIAYPTLLGYVSMRDIYTGAWYIEKMCKIFMEHACDTEIKDLLTMVDNEVKCLISEYDSMQTTCFESWGFQKFYFNPGLFDDDNNDNDDGAQVSACASSSESAQNENVGQEM